LPSILESSNNSLTIEPERSLINQTGILSTNIVLQPKSSDRSFRMNASYSFDQLYSDLGFVSEFGAGLNYLKTSDRLRMNRRPGNFNGDLEWQKLLSKDAWLNLRSSIQVFKQTILQEQTINDSLHFEGKMHVYNQFFLNEAEITYRLSPLTVFRSRLLLSSYDSNENAGVSTSNAYLMDSNNYFQEIQTTRHSLRYDATLISKQKLNTIEFSTGIWRSADNLMSDYSANHISVDTSGHYQNNRLGMLYIRAYQSVTLTRQTRKYLVRSGINLWIHDLSFNLINDRSQRSSYFRPDGYLAFTQKLNDELKWIHNINIRHQLLNNLPYFNCPVRVSPRIFLVNDNRPELQMSFSYQSILSYQDLFRQQNGQVDFLYAMSDKSLAPFMTFKERLIWNQPTQIDRSQAVWQINARFEKFLPLVHSTVSLSTNLSSTAYFNYLNIKQLRENRSLNQKAGLHIKTSFPVFFNVSYHFSIEDGTIITGDNKQSGTFLWHQGLSLNWKKGKGLYGQIRSDWYRTQRDSDRSILFLDALISYRPHKKRYGFSINAKNILNHSVFQNTQILDYNRMSNQMSLRPLTVLLEWSHQF
jgi:hypothetical protein